MTKLLYMLPCALPIVAVNAFQPSLMKTVALRTTRLHSNVPRSAFYEFDPVSKMDLNHAHECADNFGKCSIKELEEMKKGEQQASYWQTKTNANANMEWYYLTILILIFLINSKL